MNKSQKTAVRNREQMNKLMIQSAAGNMCGIVQPHPLINEFISTTTNPAPN
jgi:hypothetical protein